MYTFNYNVSRFRKGSEYITETVLEARFRFAYETAPKDRREIRKRCKKKKVSDYLYDKDFKSAGKEYYDENIFKKKTSEGVKLKLTFTSSPWLRLGVDLNIRADSQVPLEEMFDLEEFKDYLLTGKIKEE